MFVRDKYDRITGLDVRKLVKLVGAVVVLIVLLFLSLRLVEGVDADEILIVQAPSGSIYFYTTPGLHPQWLGKTTFYPKRAMYDFNIPIRFNDGGHGVLKGSIQYEYPLDPTSLRAIYTRFPSPEAVQTQLIEKVVDKSVYLTGTLMTSKESYSDKKNDLIRFIEDQIQNGVYRTTTKQVEVEEEVASFSSDTESKTRRRTITVVEVALDKNSGQILRQEEAVLKSFGVKPFNFAIKELQYDAAVETQIKAQQQLVMDVQTSIAEAKKAEQRAITAEKNGQANAAEARWRQEVIKAEAVTEAEKKRDVAKLGKEAAEYERQRLILEGQGEAEKRRLIMSADGALNQKLEAWKAVNGMYAEAIKSYRGSWVPSVVMGQNGSGQSNNAALSLVELLTAKTAKELAVDVNGKQ